MIKSKLGSGPSVTVRYLKSSLSLESHEEEGMILENMPEELYPWFLSYSKKEEIALPPLELEVSSFTKQVLFALKEVPLGEIISYQQLAIKLGSPKACRAVASACGRNPFPLLIPCHRIVASSGLGGFSFGLEVKTKLLAHELGISFASSFSQRKGGRNDRNRDFEKDIRVRVCS